jgi:hypothetical protein
LGLSSSGTHGLGASISVSRNSAIWSSRQIVF